MIIFTSILSKPLEHYWHIVVIFDLNITPKGCNKIHSWQDIGITSTINVWKLLHSIIECVKFVDIRIRMGALHIIVVGI